MSPEDAATAAGRAAGSAARPTVAAGQAPGSAARPTAAAGQAPGSVPRPTAAAGRAPGWAARGAAGRRPSVTVIIPVKDDAERLELCLAAVSAQDYPGTVETVVVDNGSAGRAELDVADRWGAVGLREPTPGSYAARNAALAKAGGELLAFTDADCLPRRDWLRRGVDQLTLAAARGERPVVAGAVRVFARDARAPSLAEAWDVVRGLPQERYAAAGWAATANLLVSRVVFDEVGPFVSGLRSGGDAEWGRRAVAAGCTVVFAGDAVVDHPARERLADLSRKLRRVHRGARERAALGGPAAPRVGPALLATRPPVGAARLAVRSPALPTWRSRVTFVAAEWLVRFLGARLVIGEALRARRARRR